METMSQRWPPLDDWLKDTSSKQHPPNLSPIKSNSISMFQLRLTTVLFLLQTRASILKKVDTVHLKYIVSTSYFCFQSYDSFLSCPPTSRIKTLQICFHILSVFEVVVVIDMVLLLPPLNLGVVSLIYYLTYYSFGTDVELGSARNSPRSNHVH